MVFQCINIRQFPWEVVKPAAFGLGFQHLPRDLANVNTWKTMFDPYIGIKDETETLLLYYSEGQCVPLLHTGNTQLLYKCTHAITI